MGMKRTQRKRSRLALSGRLALALCLTLGLGAGVAEAKKKKKQKVGGKAVITKTLNAAIPDATGPPLNGGVLNSTIKLGGKRFKKTRIRDVNVTLQTTGASGTDPAGDLIASLRAPNGATTYLFFGLSGFSIGPLSIDDESSMLLGGGPPPVPFPFLAEPYAGTAQPQGAGLGNSCLCVMDNGKATGKWVLTVLDFSTGQTSVLNSWKLVVQAGKKYKT